FLLSMHVCPLAILKAVEEHKSLMELGVRPHSSTRMEMSSTDPSFHPLRPLRPLEHDSMPDVITVQVEADGGVLQEVVVEIERPRHQKAFLGGYRHRLTGLEYHHAAVQTLPRRRPDRGVAVFNFWCLKWFRCLQSRSLSYTQSIQCDVIRLQTFARRWLAQQAVDRLRKERARRLAWLEMQERRRNEEKEEQLRDRRNRWLNPKRQEDFNLLYQALEKWRSEEEQRISSSLRGAERKAALCALLDQEMDLIAAIGRHHIAVHSDNYDKAVRNFLDKSASPHRRRAADGRLIEIETQNTIRARELRDLYNSISLTTVSQEQRLHFLMTLKHTVKEQECALTRDIVDLVDREVDLMTRGVKSAKLEGLRTRICTLLLQYIKTPAFNPEVAKLLKVPQNPSQLKNDMILCQYCHRYLRLKDFIMSASGSLNRQCHQCARLNNIARSRDDFTLYKSLLMRLRADEQRLNAEAKIPFLLEVQDMQYLVEAVWASRSALSANVDLYNLVFVRWDRQKDWSPWNCILLSKEETSAHLETYDTTLIHEIERKHAKARRHFSQVPVMSEQLDTHPAAVLGNQLVSKAITMAIVKHTKDITQTSHH
uniref:IQ motif and ubiquitin domain containing n=1 Tax=Neolamprologus brichardi TaxID=32507 RepID=A0A3Q4HB78_NEOBR